MSSKKIQNVLDRYKTFKIINKIIDEKIKKSTEKCLYPVLNSYGLYKLNDTILLIKRIGSDSAYATIFLSEIKNNKNKYKFATKIQLLTDDTFKELKLLIIITNYAITSKNIHLPLMYNNLECEYFDKFSFKSKLPLNLLNDEKENKGINAYYSTFVELADGDLGTYLNSNDIKMDEITNILSQCFIAILSCHRIQINHFDSHLNNFLYHIIKKDNSCFHYKYDDLEFYIENLGLNWVIWDFGYSEIITSNDNKDFKKDYLMLIATLIEYYAKIDLFKIIFNKIDLFKSDYDLIKYFLENKILFSSIPIGKIITTIIL